ncbi:MAG: peptidoglycan DD-metalloendopeptidase family protein [Aquificae bacterium]|nr:peptidoglycan DD-metalloendopeptidase family protein [Aquificota bacterium]
MEIIVLRRRGRSRLIRITRVKAAALVTLLLTFWGVTSYLTYGALVKELYAERQRRLALEKELNELTRLKNELLNLVAEQKRRILSLKQENERLKRRNEELLAQLERLEETVYAIERLLARKGLKKLTPASGGRSSVEELLKDAERLLAFLSSTPLGLPVSGAISSPFGYRFDPFTGRRVYHKGIDIKAPYGTPVRVTADGVVVFAGRKLGFGKVVIVRHARGYETLYAHLSSIKVKVGQRVKTGQVIGLVGTSGRSTGPHLHYEVRRWGRAVNPLKFIRWGDDV